MAGELCLRRMGVLGMVCALVGNPANADLKFFEEEVGVLPVVWFDAADATESDWPDRSGNERHASRFSGTPNPVADGLNGKPVVELRRANGDDEYIIKGDPFIAKEHYYVFRSPNDKFNFYAGILGHPNGRGSNYLFENNNTYFHGNQHPSSVSKNGVDLANPYDLAPITDFMIMQLVVNNGNLGPHAGYKIGEADKSHSADTDVAEVIAFDVTLTTDQRQRVEGFLASKWGLQGLLAVDHPFNTDWPVITLSGESSMRVAKGTTFTDTGATATDTEDGPITDIEITSTPEFHVPGDPDGDVELVQNLTVKSATAHYQTRAPEKTINGSGLANGQHDAGSGTLWMTDTGNITGEIIYDFGRGYDLASLHIWNHNQAGNTDRGANIVEIFVDDDPAGDSFTSVGVVFLEEATGAADYAGQAIDLISEVENMRNTRLVKLEIQSNHSDGEYVGLSEVQFNVLKPKSFDALDSTLVGDWTIQYKVVDSNGQTASIERQVRVFDPDAPVITLLGEASIHHEQGTDYTELGATVADKDGGPLDASGVVFSGVVDINTPGIYTLAYDFTDSSDRAAETVFRTVNVSDKEPPVLELLGSDVIKLPLGQEFVDPGVKATDSIDGVVGVSSSFFTPNQIVHKGFHNVGPESILNLDQNGGILPMSALGETMLQGPISFSGDASFRDAGVGISVNDNFRNLFEGYFLARLPGDYEFGIDGPDDRGSFWLDLDQDGVFEIDGSQGTEWMNQGTTGGYSTVTLEPGLYRVAVTHLEGGGNSRIDAKFKTPPGAGADFLVHIDPTDPDQFNLWYTANALPFSVPGTYTITYSSMDTSGNEGTVTRTVEVSVIEEQAVIVLEGRPIIKHPVGEDFVDPGISLTNTNGDDLSSEIPNVVITGSVDSDTVGEYYLFYDYMDGDNVPARRQQRIVQVVDREAPTIELVGDAAIEFTIGDVFVDPGVTVADNYDTNVPFGSTAELPTNHLWLHVDASKITGVEPGGVVPQWYNLVGNGNDLSDVRGEPTLQPDAINGMPAIRVDGDDFMAITTDIQRRYSVFTVSQMHTTLNGRLFSSINSNWALGYFNGHQDVFLNELWVHGPTDTAVDPLPKLYTAVVDGTFTDFWANGVRKVTAHRVNGRMLKFQIGGYQAAGDEPASGDVAEVLIYDNYDVTDSERLAIEAYLGTKYKFPGYPDHTPPDLTKPGDYEILYVAQDSSGNVTFATRDLKVNPNPDIPIIVLTGEAEMTVDAGTDFTDPGHKITNSNGEEIPNEVAVVTGSVDKDVPGLYELRYTYDDGNGNLAEEVVRAVLVADITPPVISLTGESEVRLEVGTEYTDEGVTVTDTFDNDVTYLADHDHPSLGWVPGLLGGGMPGNMSTLANPGNYGIDSIGPSAAYVNGGPLWADNWTVIYTGQVYDEDGKVAFLENIVDKAQLRVNGQLLLDDAGWNNETTKSVDFGEGGWFDFEFRMSNGEGGAGLVGNLGFGIDPEDDGTFIQAKNSNLNTMDVFRVQGADYTKFIASEPGTYEITYTATDDAGNTTTAIRKMIVVENMGVPFIALNGESHEIIEVASIANYTDPGAVVKAANGTDVLEASLQGEGTVDPNVPGTYEIRYFHDGAKFVIRTVEVVDTTPPEISLQGEDPMIVFLGKDFLEPGASATDALDGDVAAISELYPLPNHLAYDVHLEGFSDSNLDFTGNGGVLAMDPVGSVLFRSQDDGVGIDFPGDLQIQNSHPALTRTDNFQLIFHGIFNASRDGEYEFETTNIDDRGTIWLDKDRDGVYERPGDLGDERLTWGNQTSVIFLTKGEYPVIIAHAEGGGLARFRALFRTPPGAGPESMTVINPSSPEQDGIWMVPANTLDTSVPGFHKLAYVAVDNAGNLSTAYRNVIVKENPNKPLLVMVGAENISHNAGKEYVDPGVLLEDAEGNVLDESQVTVSGMPTGSEVGEFTIQYSFTDQDGNAAEPIYRNVLIMDLLPPVITLNGSDRVNVQVGQPYVDPGAVAEDSFDDDVRIISSLAFIKDGLVLHLDAGSFKGVLQDGDMITTQWDDLSGEGNHADGFRNNVTDAQRPTWVEVGTHGQPTVNFNGQSIIYTSKNFEADLAYYTIFSIARYTGGDSERVISSRGRNWLFGFHGNTIRRWHSDGWAFNQGGSDTNWHMHTGTANPFDSASFWLDNNLLGENLNGLHNSQYKPRNINLGGYNDTNELSKSEVSEVLLYDRELSRAEIQSVQSHLSIKYGLPNAGTFSFSDIDTSEIGEHTITYIAVDGSGNSSEVTRTVIIVDTPLPIIQLTGDPVVTHPTGQPYVDAGASITDADGNSIAGTPTFTTNINTEIPGEYSYTYDFTDGQGKSAPSAVRVINVVDQTPPVITLVDGPEVELQTGNEFIDPGFSALDAVDGDVQVTVSTLAEDVVWSRGFFGAGSDANLDFQKEGGLLSMKPDFEGRFKGPQGGEVWVGNQVELGNLFPGFSMYNVQVLITGHFHTATGGTYEFGVDQPDDRITFWFDIDGDGEFEWDTPEGGERMNDQHQFGYRIFDLPPGYYRYAIGFRQGGGGANIRPQFRAIRGVGPSLLSRINPADPLQKGLWVQYNPVNGRSPGEHFVTYTATDAAGNISTSVRKVIVRSNPDASVIELAGEAMMDHPVGTDFVDPGASLEDLSGNEVPGDPVVTGEVDTKVVGKYVLEYNFASAEGIAARTVKRIVNVVDIEKPVITLNGGDITHVQGTPFTDPGASAEDNYDGNLPVGTTEMAMPAGLLLHLDASSIISASDREKIDNWKDLSGKDNHGSQVFGNPILVEDAIKGMPAVRFDGLSYIQTTYPVGTDFTILTVSQLSGASNQRLFASLDENWYMGYDSGKEDAMFVANGWVSGAGRPATLEPRLYTAVSGNQEVRLFADGVDKSVFVKRRDTNYRMGLFQIGAHRAGENAAAGDVAEVLIFDHPLTRSEILSLEVMLNAKYQLNGVTGGNFPVDVNQLGEYDIVYQTIDSAGNIASTTRKVTVVTDPDAPVITLLGDAEMQHEAGESFVDPGVTLKDSDGNDLDASLVVVDGSVLASVPGDYLLRYNYETDRGKIAGEVTRLVFVRDSQAPSITLAGDEVVKLKIGDQWTDPGATATDLANGNLAVVSDLEITPGQLARTGFKNINNDAILNLDQNGGLLTENPGGTGYLREGPGSRGFDYETPAEFFAGLVDGNGDPYNPQNDNFQMLYTGVFTAPVEGMYEFGFLRREHRTTLWLDRNQNGIFEVSEGERLKDITDTGWSFVNLQAGSYDFAAVYRENNGDEFFQVGFSLPNLGNQPVVHKTIQPTSDKQFGLWGTRNTAGLDTSKAGSHTITYSARDISGQVATVTRTVVVVEDDTLPFISLKGGLEVEHEAGDAWADPGADVKDQAGAVLEANLQGLGTVDANVPGEYTLTYDYTDDGSGKSAETLTRVVRVVDSTAPTITLHAHPLFGGTDKVTIVAGREWVDPGVEVQDVDTNVVQVSSRDYIPHKLKQYGFYEDPQIYLLNFDSDESLLTGDPVGWAWFTDGPNQIGFDYHNELDVRSIPNGIARDDNFETLTTGYFHAKVAGQYQFRTEHVDRWLVLWMDLDHDGKYSRTGTNGDERIGLNNQTGTRSLETGFYKIAIGHVHQTGRPRARVMVQTPVDAGPSDQLTIINPVSSGQVGLWFAEGTGPVDTLKLGEHQITYYAVDQWGNMAMKTRLVEVIPDPDAPVLELVGEGEILHEQGTAYVDEGITAKSAAGANLDASAARVVVSRNGIASGIVDGNQPGEYEVRYDFVDSEGRNAIPVFRKVIVADTIPPVITITGENPATVAPGFTYQDVGALAEDGVDGEVEVTLTSSSPIEGFVPGLLMGSIDGNLNGGLNPGNHGIDPWGPTHSSTSEMPPWRKDYTIMYSGEIYDEDGVFSFREAIGDKARIIINNEIVLDSGTENDFLETRVELSKGGWIPFELKMSGNDRAPFGAMDQLGLGFDPNGGTNYIKPRNSSPFTKDLFRVAGEDHTTVDTSQEGTHTITYTATDAAGNTSTLVRTIIIKDDPLVPVLAYDGDEPIVVEAGSAFTLPDVRLQDSRGQVIAGTQIEQSGSVDPNVPNEYVLNFDATHDGKKASTLTLTVLVVDTTPPELTLIGANPAKVLKDAVYTDAGAFATDNIGGEISYFSNLEMLQDGLLLHLDASALAATHNDGDPVNLWPDSSPNGYDADGKQGNPSFVLNSTHGQPAVNFDGDDGLWVNNHRFDGDTARYTIFSVARYTDDDKRDRVISGFGRNWMFGFDDNKYRVFHSDGWLYDQPGGDTQWHVHTGMVKNGPLGSFWADGVEYVRDAPGLHITNYKPVYIQMGGYNRNQQMSKCEVSELLLFDRPLSDFERELLNEYLNSKYNLNGGGSLSMGPLDTSTLGEKTVHYYAVDSSGNFTQTERKVIVVDQLALPIITLIGDPIVTHGSDQPYVDAGVIIKDAQGNVTNEDPVVTSKVHSDIPGEYQVFFDYTDGDENPAVTVSRTVIIEDKTPPVITLVGGDTYVHQLGNPFVDPGFSADDLAEGSVPVNTSLLTNDSIRMSHFIGQNRSLLDLTNGGGVLPMVPDNVYPHFTTSPRNLGLYIDGGDWTTMFPDWTSHDNFMMLFDGHFRTASGGRYEFGIEWPDDRGRFYLDLDQDGVFEMDGDRGPEQMNAGDVYGFREVDLEPGFYQYAIVFLEGGGNQRIDAKYRAVEGDGPLALTRIFPTQFSQRGQWVQYNPINTLGAGEYDITYTASDSVGNTATVTRKVIVKNQPESAIITLNGDEEMTVNYGDAYTEPGATLTDLDGDAVAGDVVIQGMEDQDVPGVYHLNYTFTNPQGFASRSKTRTVHVIDNSAPVITLGGGAEITHFQGSPFLAPGASASDDFDGPVIVGSSETMPEAGLVLHLDASTIPGVADGEKVSVWHDLSGMENHASNAGGTPTLVTDGINGKPAVYFNGLSWLGTSQTVGRNYTIITVSRMAGGANQRLLTSASNDWALGYSNGYEDFFRAVNGEATFLIKEATTDPHLYTATGSNRMVHFYSDGVEITEFPKRRDDNYDIGLFQMGAYLQGDQAAKGYVSEVVIYNRLLEPHERKGIEARLNAKYGLNGYPQLTTPVDADKVGEYDIVYEALDSSGNRALKTRKVTVLPNPNAPLITLQGEDYITHEAGIPFVEPGFTLEDPDGNDLGANLVVVDSNVDVNVSGLYEIHYKYVPNTGVPAPEMVRLINVVDTQPPVITIVGESTVRLKVGDPYTDQGATATDSASGEVMVVDSLSWHVNQLIKQGFKQPHDAQYTAINLDNNGGLMTGNLLLGTSIFDDGPGGAGLIYGNNTQFFQNLVDDNGDDITDETDQYQIMWSGYFFAPVSGTYTLGVAYQDDRCAVYLDVNQNEVFEHAAGEQIVPYSVSGYFPVDLNAGVYKFAVTFAEGGGGERTRVEVSVPGPNGIARQAIHPLSPAQNGLWGNPNTTPLDTSIPGEHVITYTARDDTGNLAVAERIVKVVVDETLPYFALHGSTEMTWEAGTPFVDPGTKVISGAGATLETDFKGVSNVDPTVPGEYTVTYDYNDGGKDAEQVVRKVIVEDTTPPAVILNGEATLTLTAGAEFVDPGVSVTDADSDPLVVTGYVPHKLHHHGYMIDDSPPSLLNFDNNGGLFLETPEGSDFFLHGPLGKGYDYANDAEFLKDPIGISRIDYYQTLTEGYFYAQQDGEYIFRSDNADNYVYFWLDLDQDGVFESGGDFGSEHLTGNNQTKPVNLFKGFYRVAMGYMEINGGARGRFLVQTPVGAGPSDALTVVKPTDPAQRGLWFIKGEEPVNTTFTGTYPITYHVIDQAGLVSSVSRTVIVEADPAAPILTLVGNAEIAHEIGSAYVDQLPKITDSNGDDVPGTPVAIVTLEGQVVAEVDGLQAGVYEIDYEFEDGSGRKAIPVSRTVTVADTTPPVINLNGDAEVTALLGTEYKDAGAIAIDAYDGEITVVLTSSQPTYGYLPGLLGGTAKAWSTVSHNLGNLGVDPIGPSEAQKNSDQFPWTTNTMVMYTGEIYDEDGIIAFREDIDDWARVEIDGQELFDDHGGGRAEKSIDLGKTGWLSFDLRMWNGGGPGGARSFGIDFDPNGGTDWVVPENTDFENPDLFRVWGPRHDTLDTKFEGEYSITFTATDAAGNTSTAVRNITVKDDFNIPVITLVDGNELTHEAGDTFVDPGATVANRRGVSFDASKIVTNGAVDVNKLGTYEISYDFTDDGKTAPTTTRKVTVVDTTPPEITLTGGEFYRVGIGEEYAEPGVEITDNLDTGLVANIQFKSEGRQPILHWEFDQENGTVLKELMNNLDGTLKSFPDPDSAWVDGKYGKALKFDAQTGNYVRIPASGLLDLQAFTISVWVNSGDYNHDMYLFEKTTDGTVNSQFNLNFRNDDTFYFKTLGDDTSENDAHISSSDWLVPDEWVHLAVTYDGVQKLIYVNSELAGVNTHDPTLATNPAGASYIGANAPGDGSYFHGLVDDLKVYDAAVPEIEINDIAERAGVNTSKARKDPPFRFLYTVTDSNGNTASIERKIVVSSDSEPPTLTLLGSAQVDLKVGDTFVEEKALAIDTVDGNLSHKIVITGEVDTSKAGVYELTYDVMDSSYNSAPSLTRTVTVSEDAGSPLDAWLNEKLPGASADDKKYIADPDNDGLENFLEFALNGNPAMAEQSSELIQITSSGSLKITYLRLKASVGANLTYKVELATDLVSKNWDESAVTVELSSQQDDLQGTDYERVEATANTAIDSETAGMQFIRITVVGPDQ